MNRTKQLHWQKYLTREYTFLYISYAIDCYKIMQQTVGTTITYDTSYGDGKLVSLYGIKKDILNSYKMIEAIAKNDPQEVVRKMDRFDELIKRNYELFAEIRKNKDRTQRKTLLKQLDALFLKTLCYYLFFVFLGYAGDLPHIKKFLTKHGERFNKIRLCTIDADMNYEFPKLFAQYDKKLLKLAPYMWREELLDYIDGKTIDENKIINRKNKYLVITKAGKTIEYPLNEIKQTIKKELSLVQINPNPTQVKGRIAYKGKVTGRVCIVLTSKDYKKIKEGDILVTPMTKPNIVPHLFRVIQVFSDTDEPIIKKTVKGIVTDDGGALSHASIISREMKIPCIVGTGNATKVLKEGQNVEVDAEKGMINILL